MGRAKRKPWNVELSQKAKRMRGGFPVATIAFYGPDNRHASKVVVGIAPSQSERIDVLERWFEDHIDVRLDRRIGEEVIDFLRTKKVGTVVVAEGIIGCPHEEGIDYPEGKECLECPFWQGKDRWEHAVPD